MSEQTQPDHSEPTTKATEMMEKIPKKVMKPLAAGLLASGLTFVEMKYRGLIGNIVIDPPTFPFLGGLPFRGRQINASLFTGMMVFLGSAAGDALAKMMLPFESGNSMKSRYVSLTSVTTATLLMHYLISKGSIAARNPMLLIALVTASEFAGNVLYDATLGSKFGTDVDYDFYYDDFY